jgi:hypothetical protein
MVSRTVTESKTSVTAFEAARIKLIRWGIVMIGIYAIYVLFFPLTPTIYRSDHILEIEQILRNGRKWFAPFYGLGIALLFGAAVGAMMPRNTLILLPAPAGHPPACGVPPQALANGAERRTWRRRGYY